MKFINNTRIGAIGWVFVIALVASGGIFVSSSIITIENISTIKSTWDNFEDSRSEKAAALSALRKEIGYGGMIHQFKNFVLRHDAARIGVVNAKLGGSASAIARYRALDLNNAELKAIGAIREMLNSYGEALSLAVKLAAQGKSPAQIDDLVRIDDIEAIHGLNVLDAEVSKFSSGGAARTSKSQAVAALRKAMGYGGMIHNFKNIVLRLDPKVMEIARQDIVVALATTGSYAKRPLNAAERQAIHDTESVLHAYDKALSKIQTFAGQGLSTVAIDRAVQIDDGPALRGFDILTREISLQNDKEAAKVNDALALVESVAETAALVTLTVISLLVATSLWLIRTQITRPIERMTGVMTRLAAGELDLAVHASAQNNEIGEMARAVEIFRDTAIERKKAEAELHDRESRVRAIVDTVVDGIVTIDAKGVIETFNPAAERIFGFSASEVTGKNVNILMPEPYHGEHDGYLHSYMQSDEAKVIGIEREVFGRRKDGSTFPMELAVSEMAVGSTRMFTGIVRDITERKQVDKAKTEFISTVSHELRTPLTSIKGALGLIRSGGIGDLPGKLGKMLDIAYNNSDRLIRLINDILDIEKFEAGQMDYKMTPLALEALLDAAVEENKGFAEAHGVRFMLSSGLRDATVNGDHDRLMQVLANLMSNAVKYSPKGAEVDVTLTQQGGNYRISVTDHGPGIPPEFRDMVFARFSQADSSDSRQKGGTGLGLNISKSIVEHHGGSISFETETGEGATFNVDLPKRKTKKPLSSPAHGSSSGIHILHVEDDQDIIDIVSSVVGGFAVTTPAKTLSQAKDLLAQEEFDLVVLDIFLPDGDGEALLPPPARMDGRPTPVIVFSVKDISDHKPLSANAVLVKSRTSNEVLIETIKSAINANT